MAKSEVLLSEMHHRQVLDQVLVNLPPATARYLSTVADRLAADPAMDGRTHLLFPVLAAAAADIEPLLPPTECVEVIARCVVENADGIAQTLYSVGYLRDGLKAMTPWSLRLLAAVSAAIFDQLDEGKLIYQEPKVWRFSTDGRGPVDFPYGDDDPEE